MGYSDVYKTIFCDGRPRMGLVAWGMILGSVVVLGCDRGDRFEETTVDDESVEESVERETDDPFVGVDCASRSGEPELRPGDEQTVYGSVSAPDGRLANRAGGLDKPIPFVRTAHASEDDALAPVGSHIEVVLTRVDDRGEPVDEHLGATTTDDQGRWCLAMADGMTPGPELVVSATGEDDRLRQIVVDTGEMHLDGRGEALLRLVVEEGVLLSTLDSDGYADIESRADEALERAKRPIYARPDRGLEPYVARLMEAMGDDQKLMDAIDAAHEMDSP